MIFLVSGRIFFLSKSTRSTHSMHSMHFEQFQKKYLNFFAIRRNNFCLEVFENEKKKQSTRCCMCCFVLLRGLCLVSCHHLPGRFAWQEGYWTIPLPPQGACNFVNTLSCGIALPPPLLCCHLPCRGEKIKIKQSRRRCCSGGCPEVVDVVDAPGGTWWGKIIIKQSSCRVKKSRRCWQQARDGIRTMKINRPQGSIAMTPTWPPQVDCFHFHFPRCRHFSLVPSLAFVRPTFFQSTSFFVFLQGGVIWHCSFFVAQQSTAAALPPQITPQVGHIQKACAVAWRCCMQSPGVQPVATATCFLLPNALYFLFLATWFSITS